MGRADPGPFPEGGRSCPMNTPVNRRTFLQRAGAAAGGLLAGGAAGGAKGVALVSDPDDAVAGAAPARWALGRLRDALTARGVSVNLRQQLSDIAPGELCVV